MMNKETRMVISSRGSFSLSMSKQKVGNGEAGNIIQIFVHTYLVPFSNFSVSLQACIDN